MHQPGGLLLTQLTDEVNRPVVAALGRVQVDQELDVEAGHLALQDVGDALALVILVLPLPAADVWTTGEQKGKFPKRVLLGSLSPVPHT